MDSGNDHNQNAWDETLVNIPKSPDDMDELDLSSSNWDDIDRELMDDYPDLDWGCPDFDQDDEEDSEEPDDTTDQSKSENSEKGVSFKPTEQDIKDYLELTLDDDTGEWDDSYIDNSEIQVEEYDPLSGLALNKKQKRATPKATAPVVELTPEQKEIRKLSQKVTRFNNAIRSVNMVDVQEGEQIYTDNKGNTHRMKINAGKAILITLRPQPDAPIIHANAHPTRGGRPRISDSD